MPWAVSWAEVVDRTSHDQAPTQPRAESRIGGRASYLASHFLCSSHFLC
ncbi:hypothetical protein RSAG8_11972, partial [Rhizoctonia solani AG-8 WAC10335]